MNAMRTIYLFLVATCGFAIGAGGAVVPLDFFSPYVQRFNSLAQSGTSTSLPTGWFLSETGGGADTSYRAGNGSSSSGDTYSFGGNSFWGRPSDRSLGTLRDNNVVSTIGANFRNDTGVAINRLVIGYLGEEWRRGTEDRRDRLDFQYSLDATSLTTGTWIDANNLDFVTPNDNGVGAKDGNNLIFNARIVLGVISFLDIPTGAEFWIRLQDFDATGADDGLAVDDFVLVAIPEASSLIGACGALVILGIALRRPGSRRAPA